MASRGRHCTSHREDTCCPFYHVWRMGCCLVDSLSPRCGLSRERYLGRGRLWVQGWVKEGLLSSFPAHSSQEQLWVGPWVELCTGQADHPLPQQGKVFPKLRKRSSIRSVDVEELGVGRATDYVFRIIYPGHRHEHSECPRIPCDECSGCVEALCHLGQAG